jgi:hypothetical protein
LGLCEKGSSGAEAQRASRGAGLGHGAMGEWGVRSERGQG